MTCKVLLIDLAGLQGRWKNIPIDSYGIPNGPHVCNWGGILSQPKFRGKLRDMVSIGRNKVSGNYFCMSCDTNN